MDARRLGLPTVVVLLTTIVSSVLSQNCSVVGETWVSCGWCEPSCRLPKPQCQLTSCAVARCQCANGLLRRDDGQCVEAQQCNGNDSTAIVSDSVDEAMTTTELPEGMVDSHKIVGGRCPNNEFWNECAFNCEPTCRRPITSCEQRCRPARCNCRKGFLRNEDGECVVFRDCTASRQSDEEEQQARRRATYEIDGGRGSDESDEDESEQSPEVRQDDRDSGEVEGESCGINEFWNECAFNCEPTCERPITSCERTCRPAQCNCRDGFVRTQSGDCVHFDQCPRGYRKNEDESEGDRSNSNDDNGDDDDGNNNNNNDDDDEDYRPKQHQQQPQKLFVYDDKQTNYQPETQTPKEDRARQPEQQEKRSGYGEPRDRAPSYDRQQPECGRHEFWNECGFNCEPTCRRPSTACIRRCQPATCNCQKGYVRNGDGHCVRPDDCESSQSWEDDSRSFEEDYETRVSSSKVHHETPSTGKAEEETPRRNDGEGAALGASCVVSFDCGVRGICRRGICVEGECVRDDDCLQLGDGKKNVCSSRLCESRIFVKDEDEDNEMFLGCTSNAQCGAHEVCMSGACIEKNRH